VKSGFFLYIVVRKGSAIFKLLSSEDESLLVRWDSFLVLDFGLDVLNGVCWFDVEGNGLACESLHEDLHATSKSENQMKSGFFLDIVIAKSSAVFQLLSSKDESLLVGWDTFLVLDLGLDVLNSVCWLNVEGDCLSS
jgi:uncharacterized membrane protein